MFLEGPLPNICPLTLKLSPNDLFTGIRFQTLFLFERLAPPGRGILFILDFYRRVRNGLSYSIILKYHKALIISDSFYFCNRASVVKFANISFSEQYLIRYYIFLALAH